MKLKTLFKLILKQGLAWAKDHPKATSMYVFSLFLVLITFVGLVVPTMQIGVAVINGKVENTVSYNQLTGIVLIMAAGMMMFVGLIQAGMLYYFANRSVEEENRKTKF